MTRTPDQLARVIVLALFVVFCLVFLVAAVWTVITHV